LTTRTRTRTNITDRKWQLITRQTVGTGCMLHEEEEEKEEKSLATFQLLTECRYTLAQMPRGLMWVL